MVSGRPTCLTNNGTAELLPSHPPLPAGTPNPTDPKDPKGWTYDLIWVIMDCNPQMLLPPLFPFPAVGALWNCTGNHPCAAPEHFMHTALFLTATSISHEAGGVASSVPTTIATETHGTGQ